MSALGHKRTFAVQNGMSALPPKADIPGGDQHVRFVPIADIQEFGSHQKKNPGTLLGAFYQIAPKSF
jgi:hypothetical protein